MPVKCIIVRKKIVIFSYTTSTDVFFITETEFVYCAVRTEALNILVFNISLLWGSRKWVPVKFGFGRM